METDKVFSGEIPDIYDTYLVPLIFETYASDLANRVADIQPSAVLETAANRMSILPPLINQAASFFRRHHTTPLLVKGSDAVIGWRANTCIAAKCYRVFDQRDPVDIHVSMALTTGKF